MSKVLSIALTLIVIILGVFVGLRLEQGAVYALTGFVIGVFIASPCAAVISLLAFRERKEQQFRNNGDLAQRPLGMPTNWELPRFPIEHLNLYPKYPSYPSRSQRPNESIERLKPARRFYFVGDDGQITEITPEENNAVGEVWPCRNQDEIE